MRSVSSYSDCWVFANLRIVGIKKIMIKILYLVLRHKGKLQRESGWRCRPGSFLLDAWPDFSTSRRITND